MDHEEDKIDVRQLNKKYSIETLRIYIESKKR